MKDILYIKLIDLISNSKSKKNLIKIGQIISQLEDGPEKQDLVNSLVQRAVFFKD